MLTRALIAALLFASTMAVAAETELEFNHARSPEAPPGRMMAGYVDIANVSDEPITLTGAGSPLFERVEMHTVNMDDGVMRMRRMERLKLEPGQTVSLEPGGRHLMLIGPKRLLKAGDTIEIELTGPQGKRFEFTAKVRAR